MDAPLDLVLRAPGAALHDAAPRACRPQVREQLTRSFWVGLAASFAARCRCLPLPVLTALPPLWRGAHLLPQWPRLRPCDARGCALNSRECNGHGRFREPFFSTTASVQQYSTASGQACHHTSAF